MHAASTAGAGRTSRGIPDWVLAAERAGLERWTPAGWETTDPARFPREHQVLIEKFLDPIRNPFVLESGCSLWFGPDDLAFTSGRPRHEGLDVGSRIWISPDNRVTTLPEPARFRSVAPGGYLVGGRNLQKVVHIHREGRVRFRLIVQLQYEHAQFEGKARGRLRCYSASDRSDYHKLPCAFSQVIQQDGKIVGYETFGWVKNPEGLVGRLEPGRFETKDPELSSRGIPKGIHLHLNVRGIHDNHPGQKKRFLNGPLRERLER